MQNLSPEEKVVDPSVASNACINVSPNLALNARVDDDCKYVLDHRLLKLAVDDEPNNLAREWLEAVNVSNDAPGILLARGPATASAFDAHPTRLVFFQSLAMPFPHRV